MRMKMTAKSDHLLRESVNRCIDLCPPISNHYSATESAVDSE
jgi:hypothetical protein